MLKWIKAWNDERMRNIMGMVLRVGVISSAILVIFGGILFFIEHPTETFNYAVFKGEPARLRHFNTIFSETLELRSRAIIQLGLILLIATPISRVLFSLLGFMLEKDWVYVIITFIVLSILFYSLFF
jgi:uncharacterized membrane protein